MPAGFYLLIATQFLSSLADNALLIIAIALLHAQNMPLWWVPLLKFAFTLAYVLLAPFAGPLADAMPKARLMAWMNALKVLGALLLLAGVSPPLALAVTGMGAALYAPAKYGLVTELVGPAQLVAANGWIEVSVVCAVLLGTLFGGFLVSDVFTQWLPGGALYGVLGVYVLASVLNVGVPDSGARYPQFHRSPAALLQDFRQANRALWRDALGGLSLAFTTLFWGVSGNLRYIVLAWSAAALGYSTTQASSLVGVVAIGTAVGAVVASMRMRLDQATSVIPMGIAMGLLVIAMNFIDNVWVAAPFLILLGGLGGFLVVPMNALLQHRGHNLMGAGRSIAVQNFNEQACILGLGAFYSLSTGMGLSAFGAITAFGLVVAGVMWLIQRWHARNCVRHRDEIEHLLDIARNDNLHG